MNDLVIRGGTVVLPEGPSEADVVIRGETIVGIEASGTAKAERVVEAAGRIVLPGGVDPHVHLMVGFMGQRSVYDFGSGGIAALRGGTTAIVDFALQRRGGSILKGFRHRRSQADPVVPLDYGLHQIITDVTAESLGELAALRAEGVTSLKVYMIYEDDGLKVEDGALHALMGQAARDDLMLVLHAENAGIIERLRAQAVAAGHTAPIWHARTRPPVTEIEAISRAILFSQDTGCPVHILHLVAAGALPLVEAARRSGVKVTAETCTHFLALDETALERPNGHEFILSPPLRSKDNQQELWDALRSGVLSAVTSDEVSYSAAAKAMGAASFATVANGCTGIEARLPVLYTLGVAEGRISLSRLAEVFSTWPAEIFGFEKKGRIAPGFDADLAIIDPQARRTIGAATDYGDVGYNPYEGMSLTGWATHTIYRGQIAVENGRFLGTLGQGRFVARAAPRRPDLP
ncbi:dihydropyrimidinase [Bosea sp. 685]|uniref:dihydropyrimidinase n=1 Tax=Bosea sp. 685 TaxID=3080057 RepID=UPI00289335E3|nr:dihydropyrimidinase [Bosea sp. 685]WNJ88075.1 dihydropyrimidinase [Bosea sp. 685]